MPSMLLRQDLAHSGIELLASSYRVCSTHQAMGRVNCGFSGLHGYIKTSAGSAGAHHAVGRMSDRNTSLSSGRSAGTLSRFTSAARTSGTQWLQCAGRCASRASRDAGLLAC